MSHFIVYWFLKIELFIVINCIAFNSNVLILIYCIFYVIIGAYALIDQIIVHGMQKFDMPSI